MSLCVTVLHLVILLWSTSIYCIAEALSEEIRCFACCNFIYIQPRFKMLKRLLMDDRFLPSRLDSFFAYLHRSVFLSFDDDSTDGEDVIVHATSTPHSFSQSKLIQTLLSTQSLESTCNRFHLGASSSCSFFSFTTVLICRTPGRTFVALLLAAFLLPSIPPMRHDLDDRNSTPSSSHRRMHQLSAHAIQDRATRFFRPRRIFSSMLAEEIIVEVMDVERAKLVLREEVEEGVRWLRQFCWLLLSLSLEQFSSISMRRESPTEGGSAAQYDGWVISKEEESRRLPGVLGMVSGLWPPLPPGVEASPFSNKMRPIAVAEADEGARSRSNDDMRFVFNEPPEEL
mmetsp:Transcript_4754/g.8538  ORF Transcript_4754/g.8538 Transcript_4754/m.8538 type:complete len:342 (-) Transcript_4754:485-1510(-)